MIISRFLLVALSFLAAVGSRSASAAIILAAGSDTDIGSSWRTASVPKTDPVHANVIGVDGWTAVGNGGSTSLPAYVQGITTGSVYPGNGGYALIDDPTTTPGPHPTQIQNGTVSPGNALDWTFQMSSNQAAIPATFQVAILVDNLDVPQYNSAAVTISENAGTGTATFATTAAIYNDRSPDLIYFTISGATAGEVFNVGGTAGINGDVTASVMAFNTPEPASFVLSGLGAIGLFVSARRRRRA